MKGDWKKVKLSLILKEYKIPIIIDDKKEYKQLSVHLYNKGCELREIQKGDLIRTKKQFIVKKNTVIYGTQNLARAAIGIIPEEGDGAAITQNMRVFNYDEKQVLLEFLNYMFQSSQFHNYFKELEYGAARSYIYPETFLKFEVPLPPLPEQKRIVKKIKEIEKRTKSIINTEDYIEKAVNAIVPSALSKIFDDADWKKDKIGNLIDEIKTGTTPPSGEQKYFKEELNWFTPSDFKGQMYLENSYRKISQVAIDDGKVKIYKNGTVLFIGIGATLGKVGILKNEATSNQQITGIRFKKNILPEFAYYWFRANYSTIRGLCPATTLPILNQDKIKKLLFSFPDSITEQQKVIDHLNLIENKKEEIKKERSKQFLITTALMPSVLSKAFNGEL